MAVRKVQTPSKYLSRTFLKALIENRFVSPGGIEYCEGEVLDLYFEKESRLNEKVYARELKKEILKPVDHAHSIRKFQDSVLVPLQRDSARESPF
jgi:hypothetical protein